MPQTLKGIKNAFGRFTDKFRRRTKKPTTTHQPNTFINPINTHKSQMMTHNNAVALKKQLIRDHEEYQKLFDKEVEIRTAANIESMKQLTEELNKKQQECERNLSSADKENAKQQEEINELKLDISNYDAIVADNNNLNRQLQDELAQCQGSKSRKLGSSVRQNPGPINSDRQNPGPTSSDRQNPGPTSSVRQNTGPTSSVRQNTGPTSSSRRRSVKSGSRGPSKLKRSQKPKLNTIPELNEPTESSSKRRARLANQNKMVQSDLNFISAYKNAYTQKRKEINNAKAAEKAAANQAAANAKKAANNALRNMKLAYRGMIRKGG